MNTAILDNLSESNDSENYFDSIQSNIGGSIVSEYCHYNIEKEKEQLHVEHDVEMDVNHNNQFAIEHNEMEVDIEDDEDHIDRFEVIDNWQVANDNSASDRQIRQAINDVYNNNQIEENKEPANIDANNASNYVRIIGQERHQNQLEMEALE